MNTAVLLLNHRATLGGGEISTLQFLAAPPPGIRFHAVLGEDGPFAAALRAQHIPVTVMPLPALEPGAGPLGAVAALRQFCRRYHIALIHAQTPRAAGYAALARTGDRRVIWHLRTVGAWGLKEKFAAARADAIIAIADAVAACVPARWQDRVTVIDNAVVPPRAVPAAEAAAFRAQWQVPDGAPLIAVPGRLDRGKGLDLVLDTAEALQLLQPAVWLLAGDGPLRTVLTVEAQRRGLTMLRFTGHLPDLAPLYAAATLCLSASESEGFGRTVVESVLAGCPPLCFPVGGLAGLGLPEPCRLPERDATPLAGILARHLRDAAPLRAAVAPLAATFRERFAPARHRDAVSALYRRLLPRL